MRFAPVLVISLVKKWQNLGFPEKVIGFPVLVTSCPEKVISSTGFGYRFVPKGLFVFPKRLEVFLFWLYVGS